jgi:hypothetical protein
MPHGRPVNALRDDAFERHLACLRAKPRAVANNVVAEPYSGTLLG